MSPRYPQPARDERELGPALAEVQAAVVYADTGSYQETGRRLGLDRRTVREKIDRGLLGELRGEA